MYKISICIPTYNRGRHLENCLNSLIKNKSRTIFDFEICVSDNCSTDETESVVRAAQKKINIKYFKNSINLGIPRNFVNVVNMAEGEFVWLIGDDDLLLPDAINEIDNLIDEHPGVDFYYINSFHLTTEYVFSFPKPFDTDLLPGNMETFSSCKSDGELNFWDLIDPKISFDFLGGMFLSVFRRKNWINNIHILKREALLDSRTFSCFDNTFPHVKIFSKAFADSKAFFRAEPLSVCLTGAREWSPMQPLVMSVRLIEALEEYRKNGLPYLKYIYCRNYGLRNFIPDIGSMLYYKNTGLEFIKPINLIFKNCLYPNFYLSFFYFIIRKTVKYSKYILNKLF